MRLFGFCALVSLVTAWGVRCAPVATCQTELDQSLMPPRDGDATVPEGQRNEGDARRELVLSPRALSRVPALHRGQATFALPIESDLLPRLAWGGKGLWILAGQSIYRHDGNRLTRKIALCTKARPKKGEFFRGLYADASGATTVGQNARGEPVIARVDLSGKLSCEVRVGEPISYRSVGPDALWFSRGKSGALQFHSFAGGKIPTVIPRQPLVVRLLAPLPGQAWLLTMSNVHARRPVFSSSYYDGKKWMVLPWPPMPMVRDMAGDSAGKIWAVAGPMVWTDQGWPTLAVLRGDDWSAVAVPSGFSAKRIVISSGEFWMFDESGLWLRAGAEWRRKKLKGSKDLVVDSAGRVFVVVRSKPGSSSWELHRFDPPNTGTGNEAGG